MSGPRVHHTEEACPVVAFVVVVVANDKFHHFPIVLFEVVVHQTEHRCCQREVSIVEVVVVIGIAVVAGVIADETVISRIVGEEEIVLTRRVCQPVYQCLLQSVVAGVEQLLVIHLAGKCHIQCHLRQTLTSPVGVTAELTFLCVVRQHRQHLFRVKGIGNTTESSMSGVGICAFEIMRHRVPRQDARKLIADIQIVSCYQFQLASWSLVHITAKERQVGNRSVCLIVRILTIVVGDDALQHIRCGSTSTQVFCRHLPTGCQRTAAIIVPRNLCIRWFAVSVCGECGQVAVLLQQGYDHKLFCSVVDDFCLTISESHAGASRQIDTIEVSSFRIADFYDEA